MTVARSTGALLGTDESTLATVGAGATGGGAVVDVLGDDTSEGEVQLFAAFGSGGTGSFDVMVVAHRDTGLSYVRQEYQERVSYTGTGTGQVSLGWYTANRYMQVFVQNNDGSHAVDVFVGYELFKRS